jgi:hypothetical protein
MSEPMDDEQHSRRNPTALLAGICAGSLVLAGCGGGKKAPPTTTTATTTNPAATTTAPAGRLRVTIVSPTHRPKVNVPWPVKVTAADASGKPIAATLTMRVLFAGRAVGKIDDGAVYHFVGTWQERPGNGITWPPESRGQPLAFQAIVKAKGVTVRRSWWIRVG